MKTLSLRGLIDLLDRSSPFANTSSVSAGWWEPWPGWPSLTIQIEKNSASLGSVPFYRRIVTGRLQLSEFLMKGVRGSVVIADG